MSQEGKFSGGGGPACHAPPITDAHVKTQWPALIAQLPQGSLIRSAMEQLHNLCVQHRKCECSKEKPTQSFAKTMADGTARVAHHIPLTQTTVDSLATHLPSQEDLQTYSEMFGKLDPSSQAELRNAAFHLLWNAIELKNGREPITHDKLV